MSFMDKIKTYRKNNNLTQDDFAGMLNVSRQAVSKWETGSSYPNISTLNDIAKLLGISLDDLLSKEDIIYNTKKNWTHLKALKILASIIGIICVIGLVIGIVAMENNRKLENKMDNLYGSNNSEIEFRGFVGRFSPSVGVENISIDDILSGNCFGTVKQEDEDYGSLFWEWYNATNVKMIYGSNNERSEFDVTKDKNLKVFTCYYVLYDTKENEYKLESAGSPTVSPRSVKHTYTINGYTYTYEFNIYDVDTVKSTTIYEYDMNGALIKSENIESSVTKYIASNDMLYIVVEEEFLRSDNSTYYNRIIIINSEINPNYSYLYKDLNDYGYCSNNLVIKK